MYFLTGDSGAVKQLLDSTQLDPDSRTRYQSRSALHLACGYGQMSVVEELLLVRASFIVLYKTIKSIYSCLLSREGSLIHFFFAKS